MPNRIMVITLALVGACSLDAAAPDTARAALDVVAVDHDERVDAFTFVDPEAGTCEAIVIDAPRRRVVVADAYEIVALCEEDACSDDGADEATACGQDPDFVAAQALELADADTPRLGGGWCPPEYQNCDPGGGGGGGCLSPACKTSCISRLTSCTANCDGDWDCENECADRAATCLDRCC
jgi:hypothetical protein